MEMLQSKTLELRHEGGMDSSWNQSDMGLQWSKKKGWLLYVFKKKVGF